MATPVTTRRRPMRSARTASGRTSRIPPRTIEPAMPMPVSPTPKSSAAKLTVCVKSVLTKADDIDAAASSPSTVMARVSRRSGGAHHGVGATWSCSAWVSAAPRRAERGPHRQGEQPPEPRDRQAVARRLPPPSITVGADHGQLRRYSGTGRLPGRTWPSASPSARTSSRRSSRGRCNFAPPGFVGPLPDDPPVPGGGDAHRLPAPREHTGRP